MSAAFAHDTRVTPCLSHPVGRVLARALAPPSPDRLINAEDKEYFKHMLSELCSKHGLSATYDDLFVNSIHLFALGLCPLLHAYA